MTGFYQDIHAAAQERGAEGNKLQGRGINNATSFPSSGDIGPPRSPAGSPGCSRSLKASLSGNALEGALD